MANRSYKQRSKSSWFDRATIKSEKLDNGCLVFNGARHEFGYGLIRDNKGSYSRLHRLSYEHYKGEIPEGLVVRHTCDNPSCWNPDHLELGTYKDNSQDMVTRGRSSLGPKNGNYKLQEGVIKTIKDLSESGETQRVIASKVNLSQQHVSYLLKKKDL